MVQGTRTVHLKNYSGPVKACQNRGGGEGFTGLIENTKRFYGLPEDM